MLWLQLSKQRNLYYGKQTVIRNVIVEYRSTTWDRQIVGQERWNPDIVADIEGLKLDFLILQKRIEENTRLLSTTNAQNQNVYRSPWLQKDWCETLLSSVSEKDNAITELDEKFLTFESHVLTLEQENDFLRLPLTIIMQEKSEADYNQSRSRECWIQVDKSRGEYGQAKRSQKSVPANSTETWDSLEPPLNNVELEY